MTGPISDYMIYIPTCLLNCYLPCSFTLCTALTSIFLFTLDKHLSNRVDRLTIGLCDSIILYITLIGCALAVLYLGYTLQIPINNGMGFSDANLTPKGRKHNEALHVSVECRGITLAAPKT